MVKWRMIISYADRMRGVRNRCGYTDKLMHARPTKTNSQRHWILLFNDDESLLICGANLGEFKAMKKIALGILVALIAASPAVAAKKSKKVEAAPPKIDSNEASWRLVKGSLPIYLPNVLKPLYFATVHEEPDAEPKKSKKPKKR